MGRLEPTLVPEDRITGDDEEDGALLREMAKEARAFIGSHPWSPGVEAVSLLEGIGGVVAVFQVELRTAIGSSQDRSLWVVVGDLPSVYLVKDELSSGPEVLETYCELMEEWARTVIAGEPLDEVYTVRAPATVENAEALLSRVGSLRADIIPMWRTPR